MATPSQCHNFVLHVGIPVFAKTRLAWVRADALDVAPGGLFEEQEKFPGQDHASMYRCTECGEQGYEVPSTVVPTGECS